MMDGQRIAKKEGGSKLPWIVTGVTVGVLAAAYIGLCAWAGSRQTILPNVTVAGVDVSNMTIDQAQAAVETAVSRQKEGIALSLTYEGMSETMDMEELEVDAVQSARDAFQVGRGNFFTGGPVLAAHMLGMSSQVPMALPADEPALSGLLDRMEQTVAAGTENAAYHIEGDRLVMTKGAPVASVDWEKARNDAAQSLQEAFAERSGGTEQVNKTTVLSATKSEVQEPDFDAIHRELYQEVKDAQLDPQTMAVSDHAAGVDFDVQALRTAYQAAKAGETFSIPAQVTQPKVTREDLESKLFRDILGEGTTTVSGSANRKHNVKLAASACNGVILLPGEEFSYNTCTGSRTAEAGYKEAPIYAGNRSEDGIGGGVCQPSSTIYFAVLHTDLEIVERWAHGFNTGYVKPGMDATVYFGVQDFRFRNSTDYPIKIVTNSYDSNGKRYLNVKIYGTNPDGIYAVPRSDEYNWVKPTTVYEPDETVPQGTLVLDREQYAYTGVSAHTYRDIYDKDGKLIETQDMGKSKYNMRPNTYHYNPADGDPSTWVDGKPPVPGTVTDPGTATDPGTTAPGTATDPGTTTDPGTAVPEGPANPNVRPEVAPLHPSDSGLAPIDPNV